MRSLFGNDGIFNTGNENNILGDGTDISNFSNSNNNNSNESFLADLLSSDNTEILLFIIVFLLLFTSFGRR